MVEVTVSLSAKERKRLEELGRQEGLTVEQMVRLGIREFLSLPDEAFHAAARRVLQKNAELY